ncbi:TPA: hypothetical protein U2B49_000213 [Streptococcus suis]|nr:hypothetical protein [Streptococcus suis]HEM6007118.1 hypothetical protein [Streptococcus suis]HEM6013788.1 hypothetical protein [Streptococcus suis]HEM6028926.1 hypothetical protein [Streptococcus suis]HEM6212899.1 hypothetical protein [Streptococcus suis]
MSEDKVKHLEMIQNNISRMSNNSFIVKGWSVTSIGALYSFWLTNLNKSISRLILILIFLVTLIFWFHDAYYLMLERGFRKLFNQVRLNSTESFFEMTPVCEENVFLVAFTRPILVVPYGFVALITLIIMKII